MCIPMQDGRNKGGQPSSTAVYKAVRRPQTRLSTHIFRRKTEVRDPSPDVEVRQDFWSIMRDYIFRNHVAPRTKFYVPKDDFPMLLNHINVQRHENEH